MKGERLGNDGSTSEAELQRLWPSVPSSSILAKKHRPADNKDAEQSWDRRQNRRDVHGESDLFLG